MRWYLKLFLCMMIMEALTLAGLGTLLITQNLVNSIHQEVNQALVDLRYARSLTQISLLNNNYSEIMEGIKSQSDKIALCTSGGKILYSNFQLDDMDWYPTLNEYTADEDDFAYLERDNYGSFITSIGTFSCNGITYILILQKDIYYIFDSLTTQIIAYKILFLSVLTISACVLWVVSILMTKPIKQLSDASVRIANGNFSERIHVRTKDEIGQLAYEFNRMSETVQEKILALKQSGQQKDRFIASFAHELKTPLTSIIGYADMIYQQPLDREMTNTAAGYILSEGMRLESMSRKLMDLYMLDKQEFVLETMGGKDVLWDIMETLRPVSADKQVEITVTAEDGYIRIEYDLFKTLMLNLIDNAIKAGARHISLRGERNGQKYIFAVIDDGCGMAQDQLSHITEEFYMIDKSRSRSQHGAGLGLAISVRIAKIHNAELEFESEPGRGTKANISLTLEDEFHEE